MSQSTDPKEEEMPVEPSKFGKSLGWAVCLALILLAALAASITFTDDVNPQPQQPHQVAPKNGDKNFNL